MSHLLARAGLRYWLRSPTQLALALLSIALGVAVVVAVQLANESALKGFRLSTEALSGAANYRLVGGPSGVPQQWYVHLRVAMGIERAAPRVEGTLRVHGRTLQLVGIAPLAEATLAPRLAAALPGRGLGLMTVPNGVTMSRVTAAGLGLVVGDDFTARIGGKTQTLRLLGFLGTDPGGALQGIVVADIASVQTLLGQTQNLSRIDLHLDAAQLGRLRAALPASLRLEPASEILSAAERMTRAFRLNLTAMSLLALLIGAYLVYNALVFSVLRRGPLIALLRAQGVTRAEVLRGVLSEAAILAVIGALVGLGLGVVLGHGLVQLVTRTIDDLYFTLTVSRVYINPWLLLGGLVLAVVVALLAALPPALEATGLAPRGRSELMSAEARGRRREPWRLVGGLSLVGGGVALMALTTHALVPAFAALFMILLGASLWMPAWLRVFAWLLACLGTNAGVRTRLALTGVRRSVGRTGLAVAALAIALAAAIGVGIMVSSFRDAVVDWLHQTLRGDYYVSAGFDGGGTRLPVGLADRVAHSPGVARVTTGLRVPVRGPDGHFVVLALGARPGEHPAASIQEALPNAWRAFEAGRAIFVSEPMAYRHGLHPGGRLTLDTPSGPRAFPIAAVIRDYGGGRGLIMMPKALYARWWHETGASSLAVYLRPGADRAAVLSRLRALAAPSGARVRANGAIVDQSLRIFDQTFAITRVLRLLLLGVAFVGVLASLMALALERQREHAVLRALGVTPFEMLGVVTAQTAVLGLAAGLAALPLGVGLSWVLTEVINRRAFGWTLPLHIDAVFLVEGLAVALSAALLAGLYPAWRMASVSPARALRAE
ncbi:hypothetical protein BI364_11105 [Acidihalobacter yilgarnensis]|uniref:ABC transporter permease n=1 Tax=Acidihalobacter yilgarnensis TaxID=2819280 RepID=A0A1D8IPP8_9GAMM|nr:FtsX-like permease family protein [Acidihalobacter yilgarnensis]AOU98431.1 hypothetical protein BI364_11105 [Acidihalobacter yilgarnensis]